MVKLFAHRGYTNHGKSPENSIASLKSAYDFGFRGVEFDVWLMGGQLIVLSHDAPHDTTLLARFTDYLIFGNDLEYWIDFKNVTEDNCDEFLLLIRDDLQKFQINTNNVYFAPYITDYSLSAKVIRKIRSVFGEDVKILAICDEFKTGRAREELVEFVRQNNVRFFSIDHKLLDDASLCKDLGEVKFFAWTVNDADRLKQLENIGVTAVATDALVPTDLND